MSRNFREIETEVLADPERRENVERQRKLLLDQTRPEVRVIHQPDDDTWTATSPELPGWTAVADTFEGARRLAEEGVRFALDREDVEVKHFVPAPAA